MKQHQGVWFPDHETDLIEWMNKSGEVIDGRGSYQIKKLRAALKYVKDWRLAVDVGAHVGLWSMQLAKRFERLAAFEPMVEHRECWIRNVQARNVFMWDCALGSAAGKVALTIPRGRSGGTHIIGTGEIDMNTLDSFDLPDVDFIKIDCEGYELAVLQGSVETLKRCHPCVIVEQKQHVMGANFGTSGTPAVDFLMAMGAKHRKEMAGDHICSWD